MTEIETLDEADLKRFGDGQLMQAEPLLVSAVAATAKQSKTPLTNSRQSLNGEWQLLISNTERAIEALSWTEALRVQVPTTVVQALYRAGKIADPTIDDHQIEARKYVYQHAYFRKVITVQTAAFTNFRLHFEGIANKADIWINGQLAQKNEGMFFTPEIDLATYLKSSSTLTIVVHVYPADYLPSRSWYDGNNDAWKKTVVMNNVYGWHYSNLPSTGIWNAVWIQRDFGMVVKPFTFVRDYQAKTIGVHLDLEGQPHGKGRVRYWLRPKNFVGEASCFEVDCELAIQLDFAFDFPAVQSWWPNGLGEPCLYQVEIEVEYAGKIIAIAQSKFGFRTIRLVGKAATAQDYRWQFEVNGQRFFLKGAGWCTMDANLALRDEQYQRFLQLAQQQHIQLLRAWGGGIPELDVFYQRCDELGLLVMQEWPIAWDSDRTQPRSLLLQTAIYHTLRLRNYPALAMYCGGNESKDPTGPVIDELGEIAQRYDGTRVFHRSEPYGGSIHDHECYWERRHLDHYLQRKGRFWGEFGLPSFPLYDSMCRYLSEANRHQWPPTGAFAYHTPVMGHANDPDRLTQVASYFADENAALPQMAMATQLIQGVAIARVLEKGRAAYPECTGMIYYKLNDNYPAASWSTVDWYGIPKASYYAVKRSLEPVKAVLLFAHLNQRGIPARVPLVILNDQFQLRRYVNIEVRIRVYDEKLQLIKSQTVPISKYDLKNEVIAGTELTFDRQVMSAPILFFIVDLYGDGDYITRSQYVQNIANDAGTLFRLPKASVALTVIGPTHVQVENTGTLPAVYLQIMPKPEAADSFSIEDNYLWLGEHERRTLTVSDSQQLHLEGLNLR